MSSVTKSVLQLVAFIAIVGLVIAFADLKSIWQGAQRASLGVIILAFVLSIVIITTSAFKLQLIMPAVPVATLIRIALISQFYSYFFLGQASGEAAKIYMLSRASGKLSGSMVSVIADRLTSFIGLLIVSIVGFGFSPSTYPHRLQELSLIFLAVLTIALLALRHDVAFLLAERIVVRIEQSMPRLKSIVGPLREAIEQWHVSVRNIYRVLAGVSIGAIVHIGNVSVVMILASGVGIEINFFDWCWIVGIMSVAGLVPITIGQVTAYGTMVALLQLFKIPVADALAVSVLILAVNFVTALIGALLEWQRWREPLQASVDRQ